MLWSTTVFFAAHGDVLIWNMLFSFTGGVFADIYGEWISRHKAFEVSEKKKRQLFMRLYYWPLTR